MKIAQIAPLYERVPPLLYGGTERIVSYLTEELVRQGHEVTLFASGDSQTGAALVPCSEAALRLDPLIRDPLPYHLMQMNEVGRRAAEFDVLHFHTDLVHFPLLRYLRKPTLTTVHGRLDLADLKPFYEFFGPSPLVSISDDQQRPLPCANWVGTVHHGLPADGLPFNPLATGGYLAFLGRISPEKGPDRAIDIAARLGLPLRIAAKIDKADQSYWDAVIKPLIDKNPAVEFVGEINETSKADFLGNALALLFPIDWPEPFGLVMIEAAAPPSLRSGGGRCPRSLRTAFRASSWMTWTARCRPWRKWKRSRVPRSGGASSGVSPPSAWLATTSRSTTP
jgi:glycosyltransferase involved in cell wall biosynthesis